MKDRSIEAVVSGLKNQYHQEMDIYSARENLMVFFRVAKKMPRVKKIALCTTDAHGIVHLPEMEKVLSAHRYQQPVAHLGEIAFPGFGMEPTVIWDTPDGFAAETGVALEALQVIPQLKGDYVPFREEANHLAFNESNLKVVVVYTGIRCDARRMPLIPDHLFDACVAWLLFKWAEGEWIAGALAPDKFQYISELKDRRIRQSAKMLNRNQMNEILDVQTSFNRKTFGNEQ